MNSFYIVHFMIFGLDSEYCTILDTNFIIKINRIILCNPFKKKYSGSAHMINVQSSVEHALEVIYRLFKVLRNLFANNPRDVLITNVILF